MSREHAAYSFLSWIRQGLSKHLRDAPAPGRERASIDIGFEIASDRGEARSIADRVELVGPGDVIGIAREAIVKTEPRDWVTDFEPNYLPYIDFYDEDLPWRYSPSPPKHGRGRLTPWIALAVLEESEFRENPASKIARPLPYIELTVDPGEVLPPADQLWAWAHVHVSEELTRTDDGRAIGHDQATANLEALLASDPDRAHGRVLSSRKLEPNTAYHAFLIPTFELGCRAGLGESLGAEPRPSVVDLAWGSRGGTPSSRRRFPYYHRFYFRTGVRGDFEYLVRLLEPRAVDPRVGIRDMDVSRPGIELPAIDRGEGVAPTLGMEGAMRAPESQSTPWPAPYPDRFQRELAEQLNLAEHYREAEPDDDPVVVPPIYGGWHALAARLELDVDRGDNPYDRERKWVTELNLDPRFRAAAGLGAKVVIDHQEELMASAWAQIGDVLEANRRIRDAQMAEAASQRIFDRIFARLPDVRQLTIASLVHPRVLVAPGRTVRKAIKESALPLATMKSAFRKLIRPRGRLNLRMAFGAARLFADDLFERIQRGDITASPPKPSPEGAITMDEARDAVAPPLTGWLRPIAARPRLVWTILLLVLLLALLLFLLTGFIGFAILLGTTALLALGYRRLRRRALDAERARRAFDEESLTPEAVSDVPTSSEFRLSEPGEEVRFRTGGPDSPEAIRFKAALADLLTVMQPPPAPPPRPPLDLARTAEHVRAAIEPKHAVPHRILATLALPPRLRARFAGSFVPVMAYPEFPQPMYEPLRDLSDEYLVPNIGLVPPNTISLLETNPRFIESYMVGLNHEMARELLWRSYPTDQRGSYFRQMWDVRGYVNRDPSLSPEELAEKLKDIPEIHRWPNPSPLGSHDHRAGGEGGKRLVLLVRGELLKRYPNTVVYAQRAEWQTTGGRVDRNLPRRLRESATEEERLLNEKFPLFGAKMEPDVAFLGFDLTVEQARGDGDDPGWFFVLAERPGEVRFGLDIADDAELPGLEDWDDLSWAHLGDRVAARGQVVLGDAIAPTRNPDRITFGRDGTASDVAYAFYQDPVLIAVHARKMLRS